FVLGDAVLLYFADDDVQGFKRPDVRAFGFVQDAGGHLRGAVETENVVNAALGFDGNLFFEDQFAVNASRSAAVQGLIEQRHGVPIRGAPLGNDVGDGHGRKRADFFFDAAAALCGLGGFRGFGEGGGGASGDRAEMFFGEGEAVFWRDVAEHQQDGVARDVVGFEECLDVGEIRGVQVVKVAVKVGPVGPVGEA